MTKAPKAKAPKQVVIIKAPKIVTAWNGVCSVSGKAENEIVKAIESLHETLTNESRLSVADKKKFIKGLEDSGKVSSFIKSSHMPAIPTWSALRALHADFKALPISKQLSTASASYDILGAGKGEEYKTLDILTKEIATMRKAKHSKAKNVTTPTEPKTPKTPKDTLGNILAFFNSADFDMFTESELDTIAEIAVAIESKTVSA